MTAGGRKTNGGASGGGCGDDGGKTGTGGTVLFGGRLGDSPIVLTTMTTGPGPAWAAYDGSADYASETVTDVVTRLRSDAGDIGRTFGILEDISKIITEGKGVGGTLTYGEFWLSHPPCGTSSSLRRTERVVILWYRFLFAIRVVRVAIPPASLEKPHATHTPFLCTLHNDDREIQTASSSARVSS